MSRRLKTLTFSTMILLAAAPLHAQNQQDTVGNPQLRDFQLPGTTTVPQPQPQPQEQRPATTSPTVISAPPVQTPVQERTPEAVPPAAERPAPRQGRTAAPPPRVEEPAPEAQPQVEAAPAPTLPSPGDLTAALPPPASDVPPSPAPVPSDPAPPADKDFPWMLLGAAAVAIGLGFFIFRRRRTSAERVRTEDAPIASPEPAPAPTPKPAPVQPAVAPAPQPVDAAPASSGTIVSTRLRPQLEIAFTPTRAVTTDKETTLEFDLVIQNGGAAPARNIRIEARMFNAGSSHQQEISAFFAAPQGRRSVTFPALPPRESALINGSVAMPLEEVQQINVAGRQLFVPMVAINVFYEYGEGRNGQTSRSYLVGREPQVPSGKMGGFRMDVGPRIYRSVAQRETNLERVV